MRFFSLKRFLSAALSVSMTLSVMGGAAAFYGKVIPNEVQAAEQKDYTYRGMDISKWQGDVDWAQVVASGEIDYVILRLGRGSSSGAITLDEKWTEYVSACEKYGIPYGVYLYSFATDSASLDNEVRFIKSALKGHSPSLPVYLDMEEKTVQDKCSSSQLSAIAKRFCKKMTNAGYRPGLYASAIYWYNNLDDFAATDKSYHWVAMYNSDVLVYGDEEIVEESGKTWAFYKDYHRYEMWQYTSSGTVPGIAGRVDLDYWYGSMNLITSTSVTNTGDGVRINWSPTPQASYYYIYRKEEDDGSYEKVDYVTADTLSYVDETADGGSVYDYKVKLRTNSGFTEAGPKAELMRLENPALSAAANVSGGMKIRWDEVDGADGYVIYRKTSADGDWERLDKVAATLTYKDTSVKSGKKYYYTVKAYSDLGYTGAKDAEGISYYRLAAPSPEDISSKSFGMYISWDEVSKADGYRIYRKSSADGDYELIDTIEDKEITSYKDKSTASKNGKNYYYMVKAYMTKGEKDYISAGVADSLYYYRLTAPELKKAVKKSGFNKVTWEENEKAGGYIVYRKTSKSGSWKKVATIKESDTTYYKDTSVKKGKTYYYTVRAYKIKDEIKYISTYDTDGVKVKR